MNDRVIPPNRRPIVIADSHLSAGGAMAHVRADEPEALLREYLRLIRRVRNQQRDRSVALRRTDIDALAEHLGWSDEQVLARLADLMGVTRRQRATMLAVLATGAALITISSPFAAAAADVGRADIVHGEPPIVVSAEHLSISRHTPARPAARVVAPDAIVREAARGSHASRQAPVLQAQLERDSAPRASALHEFSPTVSSVEHAPTSPPVEPPAANIAGGPSGQAPVAQPDAVAPPSATEVVEPQVAVGRPPVPPAIDDGGDQVAVGQPPIPPAIDDDGNQVAVGQPPVPPTIVTDDAGNQVAVGQPPVPPAVDDDGNQVAVGQPPTPPTDG